MKKRLGVLCALCMMLACGSVYAGDEDKSVVSSPYGEARTVVDNDNSTYFEAENGYVQLDFDGKKDVKNIGVRFYDSINTKYKYTVSVSEDGVNYVNVRENAESDYKTYYQLIDINKSIISIRVYGNKISEIEVNPKIEDKVVVASGMNKSFSIDTNRISILPTDVYNTRYAEAVLFMVHPENALMTVSSDNTFDINGALTSTELLGALKKITGMVTDGNALDEDAVWSKSTDLKEHMEVLASRGGRAVCVSEFKKLIVLLMGYEQGAEKNGGYPVGYVKQFGEMDIGASMNAVPDAAVTRGECALALYKALQCKVNSYVSTGDETLIKDETKPGMEKYMNVKSVTAKIDDTARLKNGTKDTYIVSIDGSLYIDNYRITSPYYGCEVQLFYKETKTGEVIVGIKPPKNMKSVYVSAENIEGVSGEYTVSYTDGDRVKTLRLTKAPLCVFNEVKKNFEISDLTFERGNVLFTDCDGDDIYDAVKVNSYYDAVVGSVADNYIYFNEGQVKSIDLSDTEGGTEVYRNGEKVNLSDIRPQDVVSIFESKDKSYYRIEASGVRVDGVLSQSDIKEGIYRAMLNGEWFNVSNCFTDNHEIKLGENVSFGVNAFGEIVSKKIFASNGKNYGVIINAIYNDDEEVCVVKILTEGGVIQNFFTTERVILNGQRRDNDKLIRENASDTADYIWDVSSENAKWLSRKLIGYTLNDSKEITRIETAAEKGSILSEKKVITPTVYPDSARYLDGYYEDWDAEDFRKRTYKDKSEYPNNISEPEVIANGDKLVMLGERGVRNIKRGVITSSYAGLLKNGNGWNDGSNIDVLMNNNTVLFIIPEAGSGDYSLEEALYGIQDYDKVTAMGYTQSYNVDGDTYANYVIFETVMSYKPTDSSAFLALVKDIKKTVDADNEIRIELTCIQKSEEKKYILENEDVLKSKHVYYMPHDTVKEPASDISGIDMTNYTTIYDTIEKREIQKGDIISVGNEFAGIVKGVKVIFDAELMEEKKKEYDEAYGEPERAYTTVYTTIEAAPTFYTGAAYFGAEMYVSYGKVLRISDDGKYAWILTNAKYFVDSTYKQLVTRPGIVVPVNISALDQNTNIYEMDMADGTVSMRNKGEINVGEEIFVRSYTTYQPREIVVYKWD